MQIAPLFGAERFFRWLGGLPLVLVGRNFLEHLGNGFWGDDLFSVHVPGLQ